MPSREALPTKPCVVCGRDITWRRKWARDWANVRYCSERCRGAGRSSRDALLEAAILALLTEASSAGRADRSICPSQAARRVAAELDAERPGNAGPGASTDEAAWRELMEPARSAARRLVAAGRCEITQGGRVVDPSRARGPIRVRLARPPA